MKKLVRLVCILMAAMLLLLTPMSVVADSKSDSYPTGMHKWSPSFVNDLFEYYMNVVAESENGGFVDGVVRYRMFRDSTGYSDYTSSNGPKAGTFDRIGYSIEFIDEDTEISLQVMDAPKEYNIPTGTLEYDIVRDYSGYPDWLKTIIEYGSEFIEKILEYFELDAVSTGFSGILELLKSGVPQLTGTTGDMKGSVQHDDITWYDPGDACWWFRVQLSPKSTRAIKVRALRGHVIQLVTPDGVVQNMSYNNNTGCYEVDDDYHASGSYETVSDPESNNLLRYYVGNGYRLIVDGVEYSFSINGLKLQRNAEGCGIGTNWAGKYSDAERAVISAQTAAVALMEDADSELPGSLDNDWTMLTLGSECACHLTVEDPTATDNHVLVLDESNAPVSILVNVEWADGVEPVSGGTVSFRLHKETQNGDALDFSDTSTEATGYSVNCGEGMTFSGILTQEKTTTIMDQTVGANITESLSRKLYRFETGVSTELTDYQIPVDAQKSMTLHVDSIPEGYASYVTQSTEDEAGLRTCTFTIHLTKPVPFSFALADQNGALLTIDPAEGAFVLTNGFDKVALDPVRYTAESYPVWSAGLAAGVTYTLRQVSVSDPALYAQGAQWRVAVSAQGDTITVSGMNAAAYGSFDTTLQVEGEAQAVTVLQDRYVEDISISLEKEWEDILGNETDAPDDIAGVRLACAWSKNGADWYETEIDLTAEEDYAGEFGMPGTAQQVRIRETAYILPDGSTAAAVAGWADVSQAGAWYVLDDDRKEVDGQLEVSADGLTEVHLTNRSTEPVEGYTVALEKVWELVGEGAEPPADSVRLSFQPIARGTTLGNLTKLGDDNRPASVSVELFGSRGWKGAVALEKDVVYMVGEEKDEILEESFATEYSTVRLGTGETQTAWTLSVLGDNGLTTMTFQGTGMGIVWPGLADGEGGCLTVNNSECNFRVNLEWDDCGNAWGTRPEHVTLTLEENNAEESREGEGWTPVTNTAGSGVEHPGEDRVWVDDSYLYIFNHVDLNKFYQVTLSAADSDTEKLLNRYTLIYDDSRDADERTQNIIAVYRPSYTVTVEWMDAADQDELRPDSLTVQLMRQETDSTTGEATLAAVTDDDGDPVTLKLTRPEENENVGGVGYWQGTFPLTMMDKDTVYVARVVGAESDGDVICFDDAGTYGVTYDDMQLPATEETDYSQRIVLTAKHEYRVEKTWNVDQAKKDVPEELSVILQKKEGTQVKDGRTVDKWSDPVERLTLNAANGWEGTFRAVDRYAVQSDVTELKDGKTVRTVIWADGDTYRVREIGDDKLQDSIPEDGEDITLQVKDEDGTHSTKYQVSYEVDGDKVSITNTAILDVTICKKWMMFDSAEEEIPDSVYLMLMARSIDPEDTGEMAGQVPYSNVYLPVTGIGALDGTLIEGSHSDYITFLMDCDFIAIAEAKKPEAGKEDSEGWQVSFRVKKYNDDGLEQEYKGGELAESDISTIAGIAFDSFSPDTLADIAGYVTINQADYLSVSTRAMAVADDDTHLCSVVVNTRTGEYPGIGGVKYWEDESNAYGTRPSSVTLSVYEITPAGDVKLGETVCSPDTAWTWAFSAYTDPRTGEEKHLEQDKIDQGLYYVREDNVPTGYTVSYDGYDMTNTLTALTVRNTAYNSGKGNDPEFTYTLTLDGSFISRLKVGVVRRGSTMPVEETLSTITTHEDAVSEFSFTLKNDERLVIYSAENTSGAACDLTGLTYTLTQTAPGNGWTTDAAVSGQDTQKDTTKVTGTLQGGTDIHWYNSLPITVSGKKTVYGASLRAYLYSTEWTFCFSMTAEDARSGSFSAKCTGLARDTFSFSFTPNDWSNLPSCVTVKETKAGITTDVGDITDWELFLRNEEGYQVPLTAAKDENGILQVTAQTLTIDNQAKPISVTVIKQWRTQENVPLPDSVDVIFYADNGLWQTVDAQKISMSADNDWKETVDGLTYKQNFSSNWNITRYLVRP